MNISKNRVLISVVMITYGHEKYIHKAIEGVLMQQGGFDVEFIIADDHSPDNTEDIVKNIKNTHPKASCIKYTKHPVNKGMTQNFSWALKEATGKYIALCEGDDYWTDPLKLQKQVEFLEANPDFVGVFHNTDYIDERKENTVMTLWRTYDRDVFEAKDTIRKLSLFHTSSYFFRNDDYDFSLFQKPNLTSGDMMLLGIISKFGKLKLLNETMSVYRKNDGGMTSDESKVKYHKNRIILNKTLSEYFEFKYDKMAKSVINFHKNELLKTRYPKLFKIRKLIRKRI